MSASDPFAMFSLAGRRALVTGASSGIGRHFAGVLAAAGAEVFVCARRSDRLIDVVTEIVAAGGRAHALTVDVTDRESVRAGLEQAGRIDVLVNNAGVADSKRFLDYDDKDWDTIIGTNLSGAWKVAQETARQMVAANVAGSIINISSILATRAYPGVGPYMASKAALKHLTRSMALDLARFNIRVNSIAPGYLLTDLNDGFLKSDAGEELKKRIPSRRLGKLENLDGALLLLASSAGEYMTGSELVIDGGHLCSSL